MPATLVRPASAHLEGYRNALERGWHPSNVNGEALRIEQLVAIESDPTGFLAGRDDRSASGTPVTMPDGSTRPRLPGFHRWIWDGAFCGMIALRWQPGSSTLPDHVLGHTGYAIVPWKRRQGLATLALRLLLPEAAAIGLPSLEITTDPDNLPSQRVILANGGIPLGPFPKPACHGGGPGLRFRIDLPGVAGLPARPATPADAPALAELIRTSTRTLQARVYSTAQIEAALGPIFGVDHHIIADGTYFVVPDQSGRLLAAGGWSRRHATHGGNDAASPPGPIRDPSRDAAFIRAFFVHPDFARRGLGRRLLAAAEVAARAAGFSRAELVATLAGEPLYQSAGYAVVDRFSLPLDGATPLPVVRMERSLL